MAARENIFLQSAAPVQQEAKILQDLLGLEPIPDQTGAGPDQYGLRAAARTVEGTLGFLVQPNFHAEAYPAPEDVQAIDRYPVEIDIWLGRDEAAQQHEAQLVFEYLTQTRADVPMLLCHDLERLVLAYRPAYGIYQFPPGTTMDAEDIAQWRDWVEG